MAKRRRKQGRSGRRRVIFLLLSLVAVAGAIWGLTRIAALHRESEGIKQAQSGVGSAQKAPEEISPHERQQLEDILKGVH